MFFVGVYGFAFNFIGCVLRWAGWILLLWTFWVIVLFGGLVNYFVIFVEWDVGLFC